MSAFVTFVLIAAPGDAALSRVGLQGRDLATLQKSETSGGVSCFLWGGRSVGFVRWSRASQGLPDAQGPGADGCTGEGALRPPLPKVTCVFLPPTPHTPAPLLQPISDRLSQGHSKHSILCAPSDPLSASPARPFHLGW